MNQSIMQRAAVFGLGTIHSATQGGRRDAIDAGPCDNLEAEKVLRGARERRRESRSGMKYTMLLGIALAAIATASRVQAAPILPGSNDFLVLGNGVNSNALPGQISFSVSFGGGTCPTSGCVGSANASAALEPSVVASASCFSCSIAAPSSPNPAASAVLTYHFEIAGTVSEQVPVIFTYSETGSATALAQDGAWQISTGLQIPQYSDQWSAGSSQACQQTINFALAGSCTNSTFSEYGRVELDLTSNTSYSVALSAVISYLTDANASVSVDPYIQIDPTFSDAGLFSIQLSQGIGNSPTPVPEPGAAGMAALALAALVAFGLVRSGARAV